LGRADSRAARGSLGDLHAAGLLSEPPGAVFARIQPAGTLEEAVRGADYVQESGPEHAETKQDLFARLDECAGPDAILASSTSAIPASVFTQALKGRHRCLVVHPVNPPYLIPCVELCGAPWTAPACVARPRELMVRAGQAPVEVKREIAGFILNRLQAALMNEAFRLIDQGYVGVEDLDVTVKQGLGLRWSFIGPMETADLNAPGGVRDYLRRYGAIFRTLDDQTRASAPWRETLADALERERARILPRERLAEREAWRDRRLMALNAHKAAQPD
jgi:3-hydroxyacyl-CoA dehydrogenase